MSSDSLYITMTGRSVWALLNAYYAVLRETAFRPTQIIILSETEHAGQIPTVKKGLGIRGLTVSETMLLVNAPAGTFTGIRIGDVHGACSVLRPEFS